MLRLTERGEAVERTQELAEAHWSYVRSVLESHRIATDIITAVGFHYKSAFAHGYKHGQEDLTERINERFVPTEMTSTGWSSSTVVDAEE